MTGDAKLPGISVVVPVYNSEGSLPELEFGSSRELGVREPGQF